MSRQQPIVTDDDHRVIKFRPRTLAKPPSSPSVVVQDNVSPRSSRQGLHYLSSVVTKVRSEADDYRHRMIVNVAALVFTLVLTGIGVWLATTITELRRTQDCLLVGRRDCSKLPQLEALPARPQDSI